MNLIRRRFLSLAGAAIAAPAIASVAWSQTYPTRSIRVLVPLAAGGGTDYLARLTGEFVSNSVGQQVVVENRTGAGGTIGIETAAKSPPDGYTVLFSNDNIASAPQILKVNGDYQKDLVPVVQIARQPLVWAVHQSLNLSTLAEFINEMKQRPGRGYATSGVGSNQHFLGEWFLKTAGLKLDHIPYRGAGQAVNDLIAAHVPIAALGPTSLMSHYEAKTLRFLAQSSEARSPTLPEIPTFQEAGFKGMVLDQWFGVFVPAGTPPEIIARLNAEFSKALAVPAIREGMLKAANEPIGGSAEQFSRLVRDNSSKIRKALERARYQGELSRARAGNPRQDRKASPHRLAGTHRNLRLGSGQVDCEAFEIGERAVAQSTLVSGAQDHAGRLARLECFLPTGCTQAPTIAGFQAAKAELRHRCRKIVAAGFGKLEKPGGHDGADRVATDVLSPSVAAAVSKEPRHWVHRADFEPVTEHVTGCARPTASITAVVPQHCRLRVRCCLQTAYLW